MSSFKDIESLLDTAKPVKKKRVQGLVRGWGINDADYTLGVLGDDGKQTWCRYYLRWKNMLMRCFCEKYQERFPTYKGSTVSEEWRYFSNFKSWMETQIWEDLYLDKDILFPGNKHYSKETCVFIPEYLNKCLNLHGNARADLPIGVRRSNGKRYKARMGKAGATFDYLGMHDTVEEAHKAWQKAKANQLERLALEVYPKEPSYDQRVADALLLRSEILRNDYNNGIETTTL